MAQRVKKSSKHTILSRSAKKALLIKNVGKVLSILDIPKTEDLLDTPQRVAEQLLTLTEGYNDPGFTFTTFSNVKNINDIVLMRGIDFTSLCRHHMIPFFGVAHVAYIPRKKLCGLSKIARTVKHFSRRLQVQEEMTHEICDFMWQQLEPMGVAVILEARHLCLESRGVERYGQETITSALKGVFLLNPSAKDEVLQLIKK